jgi:hypothetical protein
MRQHPKQFAAARCLPYYFVTFAAVFQNGAQTDTHHFMVVRNNHPHASPFLALCAIA